MPHGLVVCYYPDVSGRLPTENKGCYENVFLVKRPSIIGWSEKPKSLKSKNGQADYLPRHSPDVRTVFEI